MSLEPKLITVLREGYTFADFRRDAVAGLTVAIVALPLAMALAIASGTTPEKGLHTAIVAGFLISALGGSRVQIGGPTAAFIPVVFNIIQQHGYEGLLIATLMAAVMLVAAGFLRLGALVRYMPEPVVTGFTAGIAISIAISQVREALGLRMERLPGEFAERMVAYAEHLHTWDGVTTALTLFSILVIVLLRRWRPAWPAFLIVVAIASLITAWFQLPVATIGSRFGGLPSSLPELAIPTITWDKMLALLSPAFTIAFLAGVESLLSATVADGMTGRRHRSNAELIAQGVANAASALTGGLPATGAIARTATNVRAGARSPVAGMLHAVFVLLAMLLFAPWAAAVPLAALSAVLLVVAWNMSEFERLKQLRRLPRGDRAVLLVTLFLTVVVDLTVAIQVGVVLAAFLFMVRMSRVVELESGLHVLDEDELPEEGEDQRRALMAGVEAFRVSGPLFFAVANRLEDAFRQYPEPPKVFILRMRRVPLIDASGVAVIERAHAWLARHGGQLIISGLGTQPRDVLERSGLLAKPGVHVAPDYPSAIALAASLLREPGPPGG